MSREALLARTLVELADTLVDDFDVVELLTLLSDRCVDVLDVAAAGIMLVAPDGDLRVIASSSEAMRLVELFELFELQAHEGPCLDCYHTGRPVLNHDLAEPEFDRVLKTVMFTDIVKSTERAVSMGDRRWHELLDAHDAAVRRQLEHFRGQEVKTTGDGFLACFDGPARAIRCARAITDRARTLGVEVRAGLHTGECETRGDDLAGVAVHIAARVAALAQAGEVLCSRTVTDLVAGSGIGFADRGVHSLKGVPGTWQTFAVEES